jgi:hypothetical protein
VSLSLRPAICAVAVLATIGAALGRAHAQDDCFRPPTPVESLDNVRDYLILQTERTSYAITTKCVVVRRQTFGTVLNFAIVNRFPAETAISDAYVLIKSNRILTSAPPIKISLSRGDGWFLPNEGDKPPADADRMNYEPFPGTIEEWNSAHASSGSPAEFAGRLKVKWHAFATGAPGMPSTVPAEWWKVSDKFDRDHGVRTNYLIRFAVNKSNKVSTVPFQVYAQREVERAEVTVLSNIDALSGSYQFVVK